MGALSLLLIAAGAVLTFAVDAAVEGVDVAVLGIILMAVGVIGLIGHLATRGSLGGGAWRAERHISPDGRHVVEEMHGRL